MHRFDTHDTHKIVNIPHYWWKSQNQRRLARRLMPYPDNSMCLSTNLMQSLNCCKSWDLKFPTGCRCFCWWYWLLYVKCVEWKWFQEQDNFLILRLVLFLRVWVSLWSLTNYIHSFSYWNTSNWRCNETIVSFSILELLSFSLKSKVFWVRNFDMLCVTTLIIQTIHEGLR